MATYSSSVSIFQLAFAINAALPTVYLAYRHTHESLSNRLAEEMTEIEPTLTFGEREIVVVQHYVRYASPGMQVSRILGRRVAALLVISIALSFLGLLLAAIVPDKKLANSLIILFTIFTLLISPGMSLLYDRWLVYFERQVVLRLDQEVALRFLEPIKQSIRTREIGDELKALRHQVQEDLLEMESKELEREGRHRREKLRMLAQSISSSVRNTCERTFCNIHH